MATRMLQRRGTSAEWAAENPVLSDGEIGFERDTRVVKVGDGVTAWNDLSDAYLIKTGGSMTGPLTLIEPTQPEHAARLVDIPPDQDLSDYVTNDDERLTDAREPSVHGIDKHVEKSETIRSGKDASDIFTIIEQNRPDGTLRMKSELSGGTTPEYTQRTVTWYDTDGTTVTDTITYNLTYDVDGDITHEEVAV